MAKPFRPKRGTTAKNNTFVGLQYEITLDKDKSSLRVHDGVTAGGVAEILPKAQNDLLYAGKAVADVANEAKALAEAALPKSAITISDTDLEAGVSALPTGSVHFVYE